MWVYMRIYIIFLQETFTSEFIASESYYKRFDFYYGHILFLMFIGKYA